MIIVRVWNALYGNAVRWNRNTRHIFNLLLPILEEAGHTVKDYTLHQSSLYIHGSPIPSSHTSINNGVFPVVFERLELILQVKLKMLTLLSSDVVAKTLVFVLAYSIFYLTREYLKQNKTSFSCIHQCTQEETKMQPMNVNYVFVSISLCTRDICTILILQLQYWTKKISYRKNVFLLYARAT